ncbi:fimbria/pilus outer membrane usher protein [Rahnella victoriana]|uniref:fimbria/pilus outer membrane usher protein n=1 Tax=Rahnella victoriana TaxID=1510570 RepID=UPI001E3106DB|nr:fimbria/pilus outer membrane usher protein [Rahnella victoriana]UHM93646.1 fimbrial biogenesis outer membrane usher protein [Rahnella victoriana]
MSFFSKKTKINNETQKKKYNLRLSQLSLAVICILSVQQGYAEDYFNVNALEIDNPSSTPVDLSQFSDAGGQAPGVYHVDIYMNGIVQDTQDITFVSTNGTLVPRLTVAQLAKWGVITSSLPALVGVPENEPLQDMSVSIPQSKTDFDFSHQALNISVPQANMKNSVQGSVDPKFWDEGIPAFLTSYNFSGSNTSQNDSYFLNLHSGINLGAWRLRNYSTWNYNKSSSRRRGYYSSHSENKWESINTYLQRDVPALKGQFVAGDSYTASDVFDSVQFRGAQLMSDDNMLPDSLRGFAPVVRGIANSNAKVTVKQNGSVIYQTYVPPGPFVISDLYPTSSSGDLQVTITETGGAVRTFVQPFSSVPMMQREGRLKYAFTAGQYRSTNVYSETPSLGQATLIYGLPHAVTVYGGIQASPDYHAMALGMGVGLGDMGSLSMDATQAHVALEQHNRNSSKSENGQSYRLQYSKDIAATDSMVTLAGYRYSTEGFYTFKEAMDYRAYDEGNYFNVQNNKRSKFQVVLTQNLKGGDWGSLSISGYEQDYWNEKGYERNISVGYNTSWNGIGFGVMYAETKYPHTSTRDDRQLALNVSLPLGRWLSNAYAYSSMTSDMRGNTQNQVGLSGTALNDNNLSYSVSQGYDNRGNGSSGQVSTDYKGTYGEVNAGYSYSGSNRQVNYGAQGAVIAHSHGVTFGQPLAGDMAAVTLVQAPGARNVKIQNGSGVRTDWRGYAIVPYASPYKRSRVALSTDTLEDGVDLKENVTSVIPTQGAVTVAKFKTHVGSRALINLQYHDHPVPFGTLVTVDDDENNQGIVGENGQVYLSGLQQKSELIASWDNQSSKKCHASLNINSIPVNSTTNDIQQINVSCK